MESLLFGVSPHDPVKLVAMVLVVVGAGAAALPARRALRAARREALQGLQAD
jgi:hypothetical protein